MKPLLNLALALWLALAGAAVDASPLATPGAPSPHATTRIAIIIDDLGYSRKHGEQILDLPAPLTCSVIPEAPHAHQLGFDAYRHGKEVMIHLPMSTLDGRRLDPGGITRTMSAAQIGSVLDTAMRILPEARGLNNHMGSALTAEAQPMQRLMLELRQRHLFFVDSRTNAATVAERTAQREGVSTGARDIFLDDKRDAASINDQFNKLLREARHHGHAIAIGHPYPQTIRYLRQVLPLLKDAGVEVVPVSTLLSQPDAPANTAGDTERRDAKPAS